MIEFHTDVDDTPVIEWLRGCVVAQLVLDVNHYSRLHENDWLCNR